MTLTAGYGGQADVRLCHSLLQSTMKVESGNIYIYNWN